MSKEKSQYHKCGVYKITCIPNGKVYIGSSIDIKERLDEHINELENWCHPNIRLQSAFFEFGGWDWEGQQNFKFEIIEECKPEERKAREQYYLDLYEAYNEDKGFNIALYSDSPMKGRHCSERHKRRISLANKGKHSSYGMKGKHHTDEAKQKISEANKGKHNGMYGRSGKLNPVSKTTYVYDLEGNLLFEFDSLAECARYMIDNDIAKSKNNDIKCIKGSIKNSMKANRPYKGYIIKFELIENIETN